METSDLDALARRSGFDSLDEMRELLLCLRLRLPTERRAYERWAAQDGSKAGLLQLLEDGASPAGREQVAKAAP
jgi:hypothetical protein